MIVRPITLELFPVNKKGWSSVDATSDATLKIHFHLFRQSFLFNIIFESCLGLGQHFLPKEEYRQDQVFSDFRK